MTHQQILQAISAQPLVTCINTEVALLVADEMSYNKNINPEDLLNNVLPPLLKRWNCVLQANDNEVNNDYKNKTIVILAVVLHKFGLIDNDLMHKAYNAIDDLNKNVVLSDSFFRKSDAIKTFLNNPPTILNKRPSYPDAITFFRPKDIVAIQLDNLFYVAYVHDVSFGNGYPKIEFYDAVFKSIPKLEQLNGLRAKGAIYNDGIERVDCYYVPYMCYLPDLANQMSLIAAAHTEPPCQKHLTPSGTLGALVNIFSLQKCINNLFKNALLT